MQLELDDNQLQILHEVLESAVGDLSPEIADTDNAGYRRRLVERRNALRALLHAVEAAQAGAGTPPQRGG